MIKNYFLLLLTALSIAEGAHAADLFNREDLIGCGKVISVRKLDQAPMYNREYAQRMGGNTNVSEMGLITGLIPGGTVVAGAIAIVAGEIIDAAKSTPIPVVIKPKSGWRMVSAVQIQMDAGQIINLPLINADRFVYGHHYEAGQRLSLTYSLVLKNIVIGPRGGKTPMPGEKYFEKYCGLHASKEDADAILAASANLIDEANIIPE
jgi:hypothetical protein